MVILFLVALITTICWFGSVKQVHWGVIIVHFFLAFGGAFSLPLRDIYNPTAVWRKIYFAIFVVVVRAYWFDWWISDSPLDEPQTTWMQRVFNELYFVIERVFNELYFVILIAYLPNWDVGPYLQICPNWDQSDERTGASCSKDEQDLGKCADGGKECYDQCSIECSRPVPNLRRCGLACMEQFERVAQCLDWEADLAECVAKGALHARRILFEVYREIAKP